MTTATITHRALTAEERGRYTVHPEPQPPACVPPPPDPDAPVAPELVELPPGLREMLTITADVDRQMARMLRLVVRHHGTGEIADATGLGVEAWLSQLGRVTGTDRRFLARAARVLARMPATLAAFGDGALSWSQVRAIVTSVGKLKVAQQAQLDDDIAMAAVGFVSCEPDELVWRVDQLVDELLAADRVDEPVEELDADPDPAGDVAVLQARPDGPGGTLFADLYDAIAFGIVEQALSEAMGRPDGLEASRDDTSRTRNRVRLGQARADALVKVCADWLAGRHTDRDHPHDEPSAARPLFIGTITLESLLGLSHLPGDILTRLIGGRLRVDAATARRLVNDAGAALRMVVIDDLGRAIGVGTRTYVPPGWLRETMLTLRHEASTPLTRTAARN
ncbi:MAG TPA: DUF222 domain-containing protein, partial [Nitriliruptorales bacterium]